jgi:hypothetical protein
VPPQNRIGGALKRPAFHFLGGKIRIWADRGRHARSRRWMVDGARSGSGWRNGRRSLLATGQAVPHSRRVPLRPRLP